MPTSPSIVRVTSKTTSIMLVWTQPTDNVDSYLIMYSFTVNDCLEVYGENVMSVSGSSRGHTLIGLEENSHLNISITSMNAVGISQPVQLTTITHIAGRFPCCVHVCEYHVISHSTFLRTCRFTSLLHFPHQNHHHMDRSPVLCVDRNGEVTGYTVRYAPTSYPDELRSDAVVGPGNMIFTANNLIPRTNYTLAVQAYHSPNSSTSLSGPFATISGITAISTGIVQ